MEQVNSGICEIGLLLEVVDPIDVITYPYNLNVSASLFEEAVILILEPVLLIINTGMVPSHWTYTKMTSPENDKRL